MFVKARSNVHYSREKRGVDFDDIGECPGRDLNTHMGALSWANVWGIALATHGMQS